MKSIIIYNSFSGNTKKVAEILGENLKKSGEVELFELKDLDDNGNFFAQGRRAFKKEKAWIGSTLRARIFHDNTLKYEEIL